MRQRITKLIAIGAITAALALAQGPGKLAAGPRVQQRVMRALSLTDAQKQQAKTIRQATRTEAQPLAQQIKPLRQSLQAAVQAGDTTKIQQLSLELGNLQGHVLAVRAAGQAKFYAILTPDQKAKLAEVKDRLKARKG